MQEKLCSGALLLATSHLDPAEPLESSSHHQLPFEKGHVRT